MAMNQTQKKYAMGRVDTIRQAKCSAIEAKYTTKGISITCEKMVELVLKGKCPKRKIPKRINSFRSDVYLEDVFDFSKFNKDGKTDWDKINKERNPINLECQRIKDQIMLGDAEEALKMIEKFMEM